MDKKSTRIRRAMQTRKKLQRLCAIRLSVHRTHRHIYAQIISSNNSEILVSASTLEKSIAEHLQYTGNKNAATFVGEVIAKRALKKGIENISFDRSGFRYHGRIQALADAARKAGLRF